jgi:hypothetical protein
MKRNPPRPTPGGEWSQDTLCIWVIRLTSTWRRPVAPRLGFLGASLFGFGTSAFEPWILLDFLGFSRPNRAFSMRYAAKRSEHFFLPLSPCRRKCEEGRLRSWRSEAQDSPSGKLNSFSDFLQEIAGSYSGGCGSVSLRPRRRSLAVMASLVGAIHAHPRKAAGRVTRKANNLR